MTTSLETSAENRARAHNPQVRSMRAIVEAHVKSIKGQVSALAMVTDVETVFDLAPDYVGVAWRDLLRSLTNAQLALARWKEDEHATD